MSAVASETGKPTDVPRKNRTCLIVGIVLGVVCLLAVIAAVVVAVVVTTSAAAAIAAIADNATTGADGATTGADGATGGGTDSTTPGLTVKASFADLEGESFFAGGRRRMEAPYGDANTTGSTASVKEISSFKVSPLQVVMCIEPPDSYEREGANTVMGVGVSNGAANILDQFDRFNCHVICGRDWKSNGDAERDGHKYTAGWFGTNDLMERDDTAAEVAKYADSLEWLDLKDADSLASFGDKCQSEAFPAGTYRWGWVIWAPIGKMTASVTLEDGTVVKTKATDMNAATGADWGSTAEPAAVAADSLTGGGAAEESLFWLYGARSQQNFFSFKMSEPMTMVSGNEYTLTLAFDLEGIVNAYAGVTQPSAPCYPEHPFKLAWSSDRPDGYYTDTACCAEMGTGGAGQPPAAPCETGDRDSCSCESWNLYTIIDKSHNAIDVLYLQLSPILHTPSQTVWRQKYVTPLTDAQMSDNWMQGIVNPGGDSPTSADACFFVVQLLFVTAGAATPPAAGATAQAASINLEGCYYRDRRSELTGDALTPRTVEMVGGKASLYGGRSPWFPLVRGLEVLGSPGDAGSYSLSCLNYWDCTTCANSRDEVREGLAADRLTFWDACHSVCFPDGCGECDYPMTNAELIAYVDLGSVSYQQTPRPNAECDAIKAPLANLPYTLADVSVVSGASFTRIALDPSPPSSPPSMPPSASPSPPPSTPPSPPPSASPSPPPSSPMVTEWKVYYDWDELGRHPPCFCEPYAIGGADCRAKCEADASCLGLQLSSTGNNQCYMLTDQHVIKNPLGRDGVWWSTTMGTEFGGRPMTPQEAATMDPASSVWVKDRVAAPAPPPSASPSPPPSTSPSPPPPEDCASPIARWDSCGGSCPTCVTGCCGAGDDCFKENDSFSQCRPVGECPAGWACEASPSPPPPVVDPP